MKESEIKACPFCGGKAGVEIKTSQGKEYYAIGCKNLVCRGSAWAGDPDAVRALARWNERAGDLKSEMSKTTEPSTLAPAGLLCRLRDLTNTIREWKRTAFPHRCIVKVNAPSYKGYGIVMATGECDTDKLPVMLENGNTWWYPVEGCERITDMKQVPAYARRQKLKLHGCYKLKAA